MSEPSFCRHDRGGFLLSAECVVPRPLDVVFPFFADALNLAELTPPWIQFQVLTPQPLLAMREGLLIDYRLRIHGLPLGWQSEITAWQPQRRFVDEQRRGPYRFWRHEHLFEQVEGGTRVIDRVHYDVWGGALINRLLVQRDLYKIFSFRSAALTAKFCD